MINKVELKPGQVIIHGKGALKERVQKRKHVGPYIVTPANARDEWRGFYLDSDFMPNLRWDWCDQIASHSIRHTGWFTDEYGAGDTIRGLVFRLPHNRGFLAGWSMGEGMCGELSTSIYDDQIGAALSADSIAENVAEREREYQESLA